MYVECVVGGDGWVVGYVGWIDIFIVWFVFCYCYVEFGWFVWYFFVVGFVVGLFFVVVGDGLF